MPESTGSSTRFTAALAAGAVAMAASIAHADVIYVDDSATAGANTGESWRDAFTDLQSALAIAKEFDEIRVGQGTYKPAPPGGDRTISFNLVSGTILQGGYAGFGASDPDANDPLKFETILSGDLDGNDGADPGTYVDNAFHVITIVNVKSSTIVRGFIVERGRASVPAFDCSDAGESSKGGGIWCDNATFLMEDCTFRMNYATCHGGAIRYDGGGATIRRCRFSSNSAGGGNYESFGGGVHCIGSLLFEDCEFTGNHSMYGGAAAVDGTTFRCCLFSSNDVFETAGAIWADDSVIIDCTFDQNSSGTFHGGVYGSSVTIVNCTFTRQSCICSFNHAGSAVRVLGNSLVLNSYFGGNESPVIGVFGFSNAILNCTVVGNQKCSRAIHVRNGDVRLWNSVVWANGEDQPLAEIDQVAVGSGGTMTIDNSCIQGWTGVFGGVGNHGNDPRFIDADGPDDIYGTADDDPRLRANSPCIDSGDATLLPPDEFDLDDDGDVTEPLPIDLDGLPRVVGANLDMGAFEFQGIPCRADIDGDSSVGIDDLLAVISGWGPCVPGEECNADLNLDSAVTLLDLQRIIDDWGACR